MNMIRILLVDDQKVVCARLEVALSSLPDFQVVGKAYDGHAALLRVAELRPDVVLLDIEMPGLDGLTVARLIHDDFPLTKVIILSSHDDARSIQQSLQNGVSGYVAKQKIDASMVETIRSVQRGHSQFGPGLLAKVMLLSDGVAVQEPIETTDLVASRPLPAELTMNESQPLTSLDTPSRLVVAQTALTQLHDWSNAAKEIIDGVPLPWTRGLFYCLLAFIGVFLPWASFFQLDEVGTAKGRLEVVGDTIKREADIAGSVTVTKVLVKKGDLVKQGQIIMELDAKSIRDQIQQNQVKLEGQQQRLNQLSLMKNQLSIAVGTQQQQNQAQTLEKQAQVAQAEQNLRNLKSSYNNQNSEKKAPLNQAEQTVQDRQSGLNLQKQEKITQVNQAKQNISDSAAAYKIANIRMEDALAEARRYAKLYRTGAVPEVRSREAESLAKERDQAKLQAGANLQQARLRYREQQNSYSKLVQQSKADIEQAKLRLTEQQSTYQRTVGQLQADIAQAELRLLEQQRGSQSLTQGGKLAVGKSDQQLQEVQSQVTTLQTEVAQAQYLSQALDQQLAKYIIRADVEGRILELPITREGAVVQPKQLIAEIAPQTGQTANLVFKGEISASQSESLRSSGVGKEVRLKFDEFPFESYGVVPGKLSWISPNSTIAPTAEGTRTSYEVRVALAQSCIKYRNECLSFKTGQPATAEIIIRKRRVIDFVIDPFVKLKSGN
jgi:hemolysin D